MYWSYIYYIVIAMCSIAVVNKKTCGLCSSSNTWLMIRLFPGRYISQIESRVLHLLPIQSGHLQILTTLTFPLQQKSLPGSAVCGSVSSMWLQRHRWQRAAKKSSIPSFLRSIISWSWVPWAFCLNRRERYISGTKSVMIVAGSFFRIRAQGTIPAIDIQFCTSARIF